MFSRSTPVSANILSRHFNKSTCSSWTGDRFTATYRYWLENVKDWCISRQLWWGHQIPAWYTDSGAVYVAHDEAEAKALAGRLLTLLPPRPRRFAIRGVDTVHQAVRGELLSAEPAVVTAERVDFSGLRFWAFEADKCRFVDCDFSRVCVEWLPFADGSSLFERCRFERVEIGDFGDVRLEGPDAIAAGIAAFGWRPILSTLYTAGLCTLVGYAIFNGLLARNRSASVVPWVLRGVYVPDIITILASLYFILGDIDR